MIEIILGKYNYWIYIALMMIGFYAMIAKENLVKKILGMNIFQTGVILLYVSISKVSGGTVPIIWDKGGPYDNPLPHVLMLTAIVVSVSTTAVALALIVRIYKSYSTIEDDQIVVINSHDGDKEIPSEKASTII